MKLRIAICWFLLAAGPPPAQAGGGGGRAGRGAPPVAPARPNVVFILADDLGWTDVACYGSEFYETPAIDRLAAGGMRFTQNYSACTVCSPTRPCLLIRHYPARPQ